MISRLFSKFSITYRNMVTSLVVALVLYFCTVTGLYFPGIWPLEGGISFLPYIFFIILLWLIGTILFTAYSWKLIGKDIRQLLGMQIALLFVFAFISWLPLQEFAYTRPNANSAPSAQSPKIRVAFFNKLLTNEEYGSISAEIERLKPDIIGFAEFGSDERKKIDALKNYRYFLISKCDCSRPNSDSALFSLLPMQDPKVMKSDFGGFPILNATLLGSQAALNVYVVHPRSPLVPSDLTLRNRELEYLTTVLADTKERPTILMGDFNTTPWSPSYRRFLSAAPHLVDTAAGTGLQFTWRWIPFIANHIDHILTSKHFYIQDFQVDGTFGSDHSLIYTDVKL